MRILLIEDDPDLAALVSQALYRSGFQTDVCHDGSDGLYYARTQVYDAIVLDRMLPEIDGLTVLEAIRRHGLLTPVILATALDGLSDRICGLDAGADDFMVKTFAVEVLMARIRAVTRRPGNLRLSQSLTAFGLSLDPESHRLEYGGTAVSLSRKEAALLGYFMQNPGQTLPRSRILSYVWGSSSDVEEGNLDNYVYFLRRRLKALDAPVRLVTVHGVGYRLTEERGA